MFLTLLKLYWKQALIAAIIIAVGLYWNSLLKDRTELIQLTVKFEQMQKTIDSYQKTLDGLRTIGINQQKRLDESIATSNTVATKMDKQINKIIQQNPPKECNAAVQWFIDTKGDLSWDVKQ